MATTARQSKPQRKGPQDPARRASAWQGARASPTYSPGTPNSRLPPQGAASPGFPPLGAHANSNGGTPPPRPAESQAPHDRILAQLSGLTGTTVTLSTKTHMRYEGTIASTSGEGDTTGVTLRDVKELSTLGAPLRDQIFIASTNIEQWSSGPADAKAPNGDGFKTDTDISKTAASRRERELQAWQPSDDTPAANSQDSNGALGERDEQTFGPDASGAWDQFAVNERLFGVRAGFDEEAYTTRLDRNAPDYKEKEKRAAVIANEIMLSTTSNPHIAEERIQNLVGEGNSNEEDKYGAVVRGANAYVPPGARKNANAGATTPASAANSTPGSASGANAATGANGKQELPKVSVNAPDGSAVAADGKTNGSTTPPKAGSPAPGKPTADPVPAFRDFVSNEKDRLMKKKQALMKSEMDRRMAELVKFSKNFKLNKPIPDDLVPILAKDEEKQRQIREKSTKDAGSTHARSIGTTATIGASPTVARMPPASNTPPSGSVQASTKAAPAAAANGAAADSKDGKRINMFIQPIPPFKGKSTSAAPTQPSAVIGANGARVQQGATMTNSPLSPTSANRLNANASLFKPTGKPVSPPQGSSPNLNGTSSSNASPKVKQPESQGPPNPFFGTRVLKKGPSAHIKEDFNPFKYHKVVDAAQVAPTWPYSGKRYMQMFPPLQSPPQQQSPPMSHPPPPTIAPPPPYEEDPNSQPRGYVYAYPPYAYPGQYPQPMMPGMAPPPPGAYMPGPQYMPPMAYPHMPPNAMYPTAPMGQMPPPQAYMAQPPPGAYPVPPNSAGPRPSMPPTPIPSHTHPYYQQSPQMQHAVPYPMMMPPPGPAPHPYDGSQAPPVMGGVGHA